MRYGRDGWQVEAAIAKGRNPPDWFLENPILPAEADFYIAAFWDLSTCRAIGMSSGPIPWDKIQAYAEFVGLSDDLARVFAIVMRRMDIAFLDDMREQQEKASESKPTPTSEPPGRA